MGVRTVGALLRFGSMAAIAFLLFGIILLVSGQDPILSYRDLFVSTFGSARGFSEVLVAMTPMLLTALAVALPSRIGLINVGGFEDIGNIFFEIVVFDKLKIGVGSDNKAIGNRNT